MNRQQAMALAMYLNRCMGIVPTFGAEWDTLKPALATIEGVANGTLRIEVGQAAAESTNDG